MTRADRIIIVGAGPAGLAAAINLAQAGYKPLVLEARALIGHKLCAGVIPRSLFDTPLFSSLQQKRFRKLYATHNSRQYILEKETDFSAAIDRAALGERMAAEASQHRATIRTACKVVEIKPGVVLTDRETLPYDYLIGADGSQSLVRQSLALPTDKKGIAVQARIDKTYDKLELSFDHEKFKSGLAWIVPHPNFTLVGMGMDVSEARGVNLRDGLIRWSHSRDLDLTHGEIEAAVINYNYRGCCFGNVFLVGDAAGLASGLTGEGIENALTSGEEIARKISSPDYGMPLLAELLKRKRAQERIKSLLGTSSRRFRFGLIMLLNLSRLPFVRNKIIDSLF